MMTHHAPANATDQLARFAELLRACPHNLLSRRDLGLLEERHFPECIEIAQRLPACDVLADLGSGGGFPGLVIAIMRPDLQVHCIEATRKKAEFLFDVGEDLGLDVLIHNARAEELGPELGEAFPIVTARAVARLPLLVELAFPLLAPGGELWAIKGDQWATEVREARQTLARMHGTVQETPEDRPDGASELTRVVRLQKE